MRTAGEGTPAVRLVNRRGEDRRFGVAVNASDLKAAASGRRGRVVIAAGLRVTHDDLAAQRNVATGERRRRALLRVGAVDVLRERGAAVFGEGDGSGAGNK